MYNTNALTEADLPDSIWDFTDPKWKGRIGWPPTNASFQAMVTGMRVLWGEERTEEWLRGIMANEPQVFPKNTPTVQAAADGEIDVGFVNHYYLHRFLAEEGEGFAARNYYTRAADPGSVVLAAGAGILKSANNREGAESFLKFLLSVPGQQYFASQTFEYPLVDGRQSRPPAAPPRRDHETRHRPRGSLRPFRHTSPSEGSRRHTVTLAQDMANNQIRLTSADSSEQGQTNTTLASRPTQ